MKIVILDGYTLHSNDLSYEIFNQFGEVVYYDRTPVENIVERCKEASIVITNKVPFSGGTLRQLPDLKLIAVAATGYNVIDMQAARQQVTVCNVPAYGTDSVAQHSIALLLELSNHVGKNAVSVAKGEWVTASDWSYSLSPIIELAGKTMGIVGLGKIGEKTAQIANAFGMKVIFHNRTPKQSPYADYTSLEAVFSQSDFISLNCPLTPENNQFVNLSLLSSMKAGAFLINASRGQLINEADLVKALNEGIIAGAALDVLSTEPPQASNPLLSAKNCLITPHNAWISFEARQRIVYTLVENIRAFQEERPINIV